MKFTNKMKTLSAIAIASMAIAGCQSQSNTLTFTPPAPTASMNVSQNAIVYVMSKDSRSQQDIATYTRMGELLKLNASPSPSQLFQQVMQQNLVSKGFRIGQSNNSNAGVTMDVRNFNVTVEEGSLRHNLTAKIQVQVYVQGVRGQYEKTFNSTRTKSDAFGVNNDDIKEILGQTFNDIVNNIYQDQEVGMAINQYSN